MPSQPSYNVNPPMDLTIKDGSKAVATAGTRVQLADNALCYYVVIQAAAANTNGVWVGGATVAAGSGIELAPGEKETLYVTNLNQVWLDADTNGNTVTYYYYAR